MRKKTVFQNISHFLSTPDEKTAEELRFARPFIILLILMLVIIYGYAVYTHPELRVIWRFLGFTFLMALHIVLHWRSIMLVKRPGWDVSYVLVQSVITLLIVYMLKEVELAFGVVAAMIGESVGILRGKRGLAALVVIFLILGTLGVLQIAGQTISIILWFSALPVVLFVVIYVELYSRQSEARQQAQGLLGELESAHQELTRYSAQVKELTLHAERERMAFELHDTLGQGLAGLILQLEAVKNHLENNRTERAEEIVSQSMQRVRTTLADSRAVIDDLRLMRQGQVSLRDMLFQQAEDFKQSSGIAIKVDIDRLPEDLEAPGLVIEHAKRIVSEALFNIIQHAQAGNVSFTARGTADELRIEIKDDGKGFDQENIGQDGHYGLLGMQERARKLGGTCDVISQSNEGTSIKVVFPLNQERV